MVCPSCGTAFEGRFCSNCGADTQPGAPPVAPAAPPPASPPPAFGPPSYAPSYAYRCARCGATFTGPWCPYCGTPAGAPAPGAAARAIGSVVWTVSLFAFLALLIANLVALVYSSGIVIGGALAGGPRPIWLFLLTPFPEGPLVDVSAGVFLAYFSLILAGIFAAYGWYAFRDAKPTAEALFKPLDQLRARLESKSAWVATGQVFLAALFFQFMYVLVLAAGGFSPSQPPLSGGSLPAWYEYFALANASVYEEVVTRFMFIGIPLALVALVLGRRATAPGAKPVPAWRHLLGGTLTRDSPALMVGLAIALVSASAVIFGLAHVPSWGWWKFLPTMVAGLGMGYLFLRHGLLAGILLHFATDYLGAVSILTSDSLGAQIVLGLFILVLVAMGSFFFVWYAVHAVALWNHVLTRSGLRKPRPVASVARAPVFVPPVAYAPGWGYAYPPSYGPPAYGPPTYAPPPYPASPPAYGPPPMYAAPPPPAAVPPYGAGWVPFVCARCGWREARYEGGRFTCLRCGQVA